MSEPPQGPETASGQPASPRDKSLVGKIVLGCLALLVLGVVAAVGIGVMVLGVMKRSWAYEEALAAAQESPGLIETLGEPIEPGWWMMGTVEVAGPSGDAAISFPVSGPAGKATVYAEARKQAGEWSFDLLVAEPKNGGVRVDLLEER